MIRGVLCFSGGPAGAAVQVCSPEDAAVLLARCPDQIRQAVSIGIEKPDGAIPLVVAEHSRRNGVRGVFDEALPGVEIGVRLPIRERECHKIIQTVSVHVRPGSPELVCCLRGSRTYWRVVRSCPLPPIWRQKICRNTSPLVAWNGCAGRCAVRQWSVYRKIR